jgi:uncharacterized protein
MIIELNRAELAKVKNPVLAENARRYLDIYDDFMQQVRQMGIEVDETDYQPELERRYESLRRQGVLFRSEDRSLYTNHISPACEACQQGVGSITFFVSLKCHRSCYYCFNPNQENYDYYRNHLRDAAGEVRQMAEAQQRVRHLALTGGEPLLHKEEAVDFFATAQEVYPGSYRRLYTCGDYVDEAVLRQLQEAGLDEIRFSIRMHDLEQGHRFTFDRIRLAKDYIPNVMVEMPVLPGTLEIMQGVLDELDELGVFGINLLEFCYPYGDPQEFNRRGFKIKNHPHKVLYDYWYAGGLPVAQSELVCLDLLEYAVQRGLKLGVHYCSLENKHTGQIYQQHFNRPLPATSYFSQRDYFLKSAKVFGADVLRAEEAFRRARYDRYHLSEEMGFMEFHIGKIKLLPDPEMEVGISTSIIETRDGETFLRELKLDLTTPSQFDLAHDL